MRIDCVDHDIQVYFDHSLSPKAHSPIAVINAINTIEQELSEQTCRQSGKADLLAALGQVLILDQQYERAKKSLEAAAMIYVDCGQLNCLVQVRLGLAEIALVEGNPTQAFDLVTDVLADIDSDPHLGYRLTALVTLARVHVSQGAYDHGRQAIGAALEQASPDQVPELQNILGTISVLEEFGPVQAPTKLPATSQDLTTH